MRGQHSDAVASERGEGRGAQIDRGAPASRPRSAVQRLSLLGRAVTRILRRARLSGEPARRAACSRVRADPLEARDGLDVMRQIGLLPREVFARLTPIDAAMLAHAGALTVLPLAFHPKNRHYRKQALRHLGVVGAILVLAAVDHDDDEAGAARRRRQRVRPGNPPANRAKLPEHSVCFMNSPHPCMDVASRRPGRALLLRGAPRGTLGRSGAALSFVRHTYPLLLLGPMHFWSGELALIFSRRFYDREIAAVDRLVFGRDLYVALPRAFPGALSREVMNAAYFSFYPMIAAVFLSTWFKRRERMGEAVFTFTLCMYSHFLLFTLVPVIGPTHLRRRIFTAPKGLFEKLVSTAIERGDNDGGALPSSHVAGAVVLTSIAGRLFGGRARAILGSLSGLLSVSTVYISMHYAVDVLVGLGTGIGVAKISPLLYRRLRARAGAERRPHARAHANPGRKLASSDDSDILLADGTD